MLLKIIFAHLIGMGFVNPMNETNDNRELYILYVIDEKNFEVLAYEHCYEEEILEYIDTYTFEYNECLGFDKEKEEFFDSCKRSLIKNK
jgi:hypothetical protein